MPALFDVPKRASKAQDIAIAKKANSKSKIATKTVKGGISGRIAEIKAMVETNLGKFKDDYLIINELESLQAYLSKCIENNVISIDTETTGLDPLQDQLVGICIYTPGQKAAYIPLNHKSYITGAKSNNQLDIKIVREEFEKLLKSKLDIIMFNACFDIRVLRNGLGLKDIYCTWDCYLAERLMNENEPHRGLKPVHQKYCLDGKGDAFSFDALFNGITFDLIPILVAYLYAAHDAVITYELYEFQKPYLTPGNELCKEYELEDVAWVFYNIEMPCIKVVADMEDTGVDFDTEYCAKLSEKYGKIMDEKLQKFEELCSLYQTEIDTYRLKHIDSKLSNPINISSPIQIAILLYDVLKILVQLHIFHNILRH